MQCCLLYEICVRFLSSRSVCVCPDQSHLTRPRVASQNLSVRQVHATAALAARWTPTARPGLSRCFPHNNNHWKNLTKPFQNMSRSHFTKNQKKKHIQLYFVKWKFSTFFSSLQYFSHISRHFTSHFSLPWCIWMI